MSVYLVKPLRAGQAVPIRLVVVETLFADQFIRGIPVIVDHANICAFAISAHPVFVSGRVKCNGAHDRSLFLCEAVRVKFGRLTARYEIHIAQRLLGFFV